ncbi:MAG: hypothetical protein Q9172_003258 [Xanthocarpia lactea]
MELHGRNESSPWSQRQMCIYQQYYVGTGKTNCIFLQPADRILQAVDNDATAQHDVLSLHVASLSAAESNWGAYLKYVHLEIEKEDEKACFSRVDRLRPHDYQIRFDDLQKVQLVRRRLWKVVLALESNLEVTDGCIKYYHDVVNILPISRNETSYPSVIEQFAIRFRGHLRRAQALLRYIEGTSNLLSKVLEVRQNDAVIVASGALQINLELLKKTAVETKQESASLTAIARHGQRDSTSLKALSRVAMFFLPATLLATVFSSSLIQIRSKDDRAHVATHFVVASEFWVYLVASTVLTGLTFCMVVLLEKGWTSWYRGIRMHRTSS